jgi:hypothetical protein
VSVPTKCTGVTLLMGSASLVSQFSIASMRAILQQYTDVSASKFLLRLSIGFGEPWTFWAVELVPQNHEYHQMLDFHQRSAAVHHNASPIQLVNPPIVPLWIDPLLMQVNIDCWLHRMVGDPQAGWQRYWFPDPSHFWQLRILDGICEHYRWQKPESDGAAGTAYKTLEWALKLSVLNYVLCHDFLVPEGDIDILFQHLCSPVSRQQFPGRRVCPQAANKFVKMLAFPMMRVAARETLRGLQEIFRVTMPHETIWESTFAAVFLCLMVASSTQMSLIQPNIICQPTKESSCFIQQAAYEAQNIDQELVRHIIGMFHHTFRTTSKRRGFNPFGTSVTSKQPSFPPFATYVKITTDEHCKSFPIFP